MDAWRTGNVRVDDGRSGRSLQRADETETEAENFTSSKINKILLLESTSRTRYYFSASISTPSRRSVGYIIQDAPWSHFALHLPQILLLQGQQGCLSPLSVRPPISLLPLSIEWTSTRSYRYDRRSVCDIFCLPLWAMQQPQTNSIRPHWRN